MSLYNPAVLSGYFNGFQPVLYELKEHRPYAMVPAIASPSINQINDSQVDPATLQLSISESAEIPVGPADVWIFPYDREIQGLPFPTVYLFQDSCLAVTKGLIFTAANPKRSVATYKTESKDGPLLPNHYAFSARGKIGDGDLSASWYARIETLNEDPNSGTLRGTLRYNSQDCFGCDISFSPSDDDDAGIFTDVTIRHQGPYDGSAICGIKINSMSAMKFESDMPGMQFFVTEEMARLLLGIDASDTAELASELTRIFYAGLDPRILARTPLFRALDRVSFRVLRELIALGERGTPLINSDEASSFRLEASNFETLGLFEMESSLGGGFAILWRQLHARELEGFAGIDTIRDLPIPAARFWEFAKWNNASKGSLLRAMRLTNQDGRARTVETSYGGEEWQIEIGKNPDSGAISMRPSQKKLDAALKASQFVDELIDIHKDALAVQDLGTIAETLRRMGNHQIGTLDYDDAMTNLVQAYELQQYVDFDVKKLRVLLNQITDILVKTRRHGEAAGYVDGFLRLALAHVNPARVSLIIEDFIPYLENLERNDLNETSANDTAEKIRRWKSSLGKLRTASALNWKGILPEG